MSEDRPVTNLWEPTGQTDLCTENFLLFEGIFSLGNTHFDLVVHTVEGASQTRCKAHSHIAADSVAVWCSNPADFIFTPKQKVRPQVVPAGPQHSPHLRKAFKVPSLAHL